MTRRPVVWITRPQPGADRTAAALEKAGYDTLVLPLTEIRARDPNVSPDEAAAFDAVAATSANAVRHAPEPLLEALRNKPLFAVGDATAAEARAEGFAQVRSAEGAVDDLVALIAGDLRPGVRIAYPCGFPRAGDLEGKLARAGFDCRAIEVYRTEIVSYPTELLRDAVVRRAPSAVLFHSGLSATAFRESILPELHQLFESALLFAISKRVADCLPAADDGRKAIASTPDEAGLLAALRKLLPTGGN